jgi:hypothetical protein
MKLEKTFNATLPIFVCLLVFYLGSYRYLVRPVPPAVSMSGGPPITLMAAGYRQVAWSPPFWIYEPLIKLDQTLFPKRWKL